MELMVVVYGQKMALEPEYLVNIHPYIGLVIKK